MYNKTAKLKYWCLIIFFDHLQWCFGKP